MEHDLKCWPEHYSAIDGGSKTVELRLNDRPYAVGDSLLLREYEPMEAAYTGRSLRVRVTHILSGGAWLAPGYIAMSIRLMGEDGRARVQEDFRKVADGQRAELTQCRDALVGMVIQYMRYKEGYISHEFMGAQEDAIDYLEGIGFLRAGPYERYYWTEKSGVESAPASGEETQV